MIGLISGTLFERSGHHWIVNVGSTNGFVGYSILVPNRNAYDKLTVGAAVQLRIYTHVREDALDLFGFLTALEKELFLTLLSVNGVGPKVAMGLLSAVEPADLIRAILEGDRVSLQRLPGIGNKTAERLLVELRDVIRKKVDGGILVALPPPGGARNASHPSASGFGGVWSEVREALMGLGYREQDFRELISKLAAESEGKKADTLKPEHLLKDVLKQLRVS